MWQILRKKTEMPTADRALLGRATPSFNVPTKHFVNGNRIYCHKDLEGKLCNFH